MAASISKHRVLGKLNLLLTEVSYQDFEVLKGMEIDNSISHSYIVSEKQ